MEDFTLSLYELNRVVKNTLSNGFPDLYWIRAETSDVRVNQNGHCYLEFIQKDDNNKSIIAKARASIWANVYHLLKMYFESETNQPFTSGLKVLVQVSVEFHELYGFSLNVHNIDPNYTLGDQARNRAEIIKKLKDEGVLELNKELDLPLISNRIAIISSPTAAGYEDFLNQLHNNKSGFVFYTHLFPAVMQGDRVEESILSALDSIFENLDSFDTVIIIRGGGATSDLSCFDSYLLATSCAQFPLPIITGIGHERDDTVLDIVAHTRAKTPTAVAEFLIKRMMDAENTLLYLQQQITDKTNQKVKDQIFQLHSFTTRLSYILKDRVKDQIAKLSNINYKLKIATDNVVKQKMYYLESKEQHLKLSSPQTILEKGYTLTTKDNKIIKSAAGLKSGDKIVTIFKDDQITSVVD